MTKNKDKEQPEEMKKHPEEQIAEDADRFYRRGVELEKTSLKENDTQTYGGLGYFSRSVNTRI